MNRILHVITTFNRGGAENHLSSLAKLQAELGLEVRVAYLKGDGYWENRLGAQGILVERLPMWRYGDPRPILRLRAILEDWKPDVVHAHLAPAELYARLA